MKVGLALRLVCPLWLDGALGVDGEGLVDGVGVAIIDGIVFFWCVKQPKVVYFVEFYAFRVLRAFVVFYP
ncbi:hypothetical protein [Bartonella sp. AA2SXKL]|uniref:hypothetical protein n=1 Tax=Bartonella sp. AA2SXKL TaxID=3243432 RepID=UPI0035D0AD9A